MEKFRVDVWGRERKIFRTFAEGVELRSGPVAGSKFIHICKQLSSAGCWVGRHRCVELEFISSSRALSGIRRCLTVDDIFTQFRLTYLMSIDFYWAYLQLSQHYSTNRPQRACQICTLLDIRPWFGTNMHTTVSDVFSPRASVTRAWVRSLQRRLCLKAIESSFKQSAVRLHMSC